MPRIEGVVQNTPEWVVLKRGKMSTSRTEDFMLKNDKGKYYAARQSYFEEKSDELSTDPAHLENHKFSAAQWAMIQWGIDHQEEANDCYEQEMGVLTEPGGLWVHPFIPRFLSSPDYLVGRDGLLEIKCPLTQNHRKYFLADEVPERYWYQIQGQLCVTGRQWCDFASYDPRVRKDIIPQLWIKRVFRDEPMILAIETEVRFFWEQMDADFKKLSERNNVYKKPQPRDVGGKSWKGPGAQLHAAGNARGEAIARNQRAF